jgi:hypothetical protein
MKGVAAASGSNNQAGVASLLTATCILSVMPMAMVILARQMGCQWWYDKQTTTATSLGGGDSSIWWRSCQRQLDGVGQWMEQYQILRFLLLARRGGGGRRTVECTSSRVNNNNDNNKWVFIEYIIHSSSKNKVVCM